MSLCLPACHGSRVTGHAHEPLTRAPEGHGDGHQDGTLRSADLGNAVFNKLSLLETFLLLLGPHVPEAGSSIPSCKMTVDVVMGTHGDETLLLLSRC